MTTRTTTALLALALVFTTSMAAAQSDFPNRLIRLLVGFPPGGSTDVLGRALAFESRKSLGQEVLVVNKPGASGVIAVNEVAAAGPDGYTIGISPSTAFTLAHHFMDIRPDLLEATTALLMVGRQRIGMVVKGDSPHKTLKDLVEFARKNPGKASVGIPGTGTSVELFTRAVLLHDNVNVVVVPFKGDAGVVTGLLGGHIAAGSFSAGGWAQQVQGGAMRLIASFESDRFDVAPNVPTLAEMGYGLTGAAIQYLYGPKGLPPAVAKRLIAVFAEAMQAPSYVEVATKNALYDKHALDGDALSAYLLKDRAANSALVEKVGLKKNR